MRDMTALFDGMSGRYLNAQLSFDLRDYQAAADELEEVLSEDPRAVAVRLLLARSYYHAARLAKAEQAAREVIELAPTEAYAHLLLGRALQRQGRHDEAAGPLRIAAAMNPEFTLD